MNAAILREIDGLRKEINRLRPFTGKSLDDLKSFYRVGLTYSSNALEGNSLTESETKIVLEEGLTVSGKSLKDHYEAIGHAEALEMLFSQMREKTLTSKDVKKLHFLFYHRIDRDNAGQYRKTKVFLTGSKYPLPAPAAVPARMKSFFKRQNAHRRKTHVVETAALAHKEFVFINPFVDGNGRVARLLMNLLLLQEGYLPAVIPPILRPEYIGLLELAHENDQPFLDFIGERERESQKDFLRIFR